MLTALAVLARILANPVANVFQKQLAQRSASPMFVIAATHAFLSIVCLPALLAVDLPTLPSFWLDISVCALLAVSSNVLLVYALEAGDLSILGPINAYKPVVALAVGVFLLDEVPSPMGLGGIVLVLAGSAFLAERSAGPMGLSAAVRLRFAALALSATEAVFLKRALLAATPLTTFLLWAVLGVPVAACFLAIFARQRVAAELTLLRTHWRSYAAMTLATGVMQSATLFTFDKLQVGYSLALFQLSAVISVVFGYRFFREPSFQRRLAGSLVMAAGAALIVVFGRT